MAQAVQAKFGQSRNDMYWSLYAGEDKFIRWGGYDDAYWWQNVAPTDAWRTRVGDATKRTYILDPDTSTVLIVEPATPPVDMGEK